MPITSTAEAKHVLNQFSILLDFGGTDFKINTLASLLTIPFGETRSYREIARQVDSPNGLRAVGAVNWRNSVSIIVPCDRAIGANGTLICRRHRNKAFPPQA